MTDIDVDALDELVRLVEEECTSAATEEAGDPIDGPWREPDDEPVGWAGGHDGEAVPLPMTFGHIRRARAAITALRAQSAPAPDDVREAVARGLYNHEWARDGMGKIWGENTDRPYWLALADAAIAAYRATD